MKKTTTLKKSWFKLVVVTLLLIVAYMVVKSYMVSPQVAEISGDTCVSNVAAISFANECSQGTFSKAIYTCKNGATAEKIGNTTCFSYEAVYKEALDNCGMTCSPLSTSTPTPTPVASPSAKPTAAAVPSRMPTATPTPTPQAVKSQSRFSRCMQSCRAQQSRATWRCMLSCR